MGQPAIPGVTYEHADVNGVRLHYARAGQGPPMLFLHGFPQFLYMWRHQVEEFSRDHTVIALDQRGYNLSSKPAEYHEYGIWPATEDARQLMEHLGYEKFVLVGHDWGGGVAYAFALRYPERLEAAVVLTTAHPALLERELRRSEEQQRASQYMLVTRRPDASEVLARDDLALLRAELEQQPFYDDADTAAYMQAWSEPDALRAMCSWYRREGLGPEDPDGTPSHGNYIVDVAPQIISVPTLVIHSEGDSFIRPSCFEGLDRYVKDLKLVKVEGTHWIPEEQPDLVNRLIREFVSERVGATPVAA